MNFSLYDNENFKKRRMPADVKKMCKGADVETKGLAIKGSQAKESKDNNQLYGKRAV